MRCNTNVVSSYYYKITGLQIFREFRSEIGDWQHFEYEFIFIPEGTKWNYL
jgi:hypothetical protein